MAEKKMKNPCWKGYEAYGMKKKNGKEVPNCVPIKESIKETIIFNFMENAKPQFTPRGGQQRQRPKKFGKGGKAGTERTQDRRQGKKESDPREVYETVSVYNPLQQAQQEQPSQKVKPTRTSAPETREKISGVPETPSSTHHSMQLKMFKSLVTPKSETSELARHLMSGESPLNTADTPTFAPTHGDAGAYDVGRDATISSLHRELDRLQSDLKNARFDINARRRQDSEREARENAERNARFVKREAKRRQTEGPGLFDGI